MSDKTIGHIDCNVCGSGRAHVRIAKTQLAYVVCARCNSQTFARSDLSDTLIRSRMRQVPEKVPEKVPELVPEVVPEVAPGKVQAPTRGRWKEPEKAPKLAPGKEPEKVQEDGVVVPEVQVIPVPDRGEWVPFWKV